jgi:hypothetical protein
VLCGGGSCFCCVVAAVSTVDAHTKKYRWLSAPKNSKSATTNKILGSVVNLFVYFFFKLQRMIYTNQAVALRPPSTQYCERYCKKRRIIRLLPPKNSKSGTTMYILSSVVNLFVYFFLKLQRMIHTNQAVAVRPQSV